MNPIASVNFSFSKWTARLALVPVAGSLLLAALAEPSVVMTARRQIGQTVSYVPDYVVLQYPGGDVPKEGGVCTDVVIRALRESRALDLQKLVYEDMRRNFSKYPHNWGLSGPDKNIDHRRVPNLQTFFKRRGWELPITQVASDYAPDDLVTCIVPPNLPHIMLVSDRKTSDGRPLVVHNIGNGTREEDRLFDFEITGHYRIREK